MGDKNKDNFMAPPVWKVESMSYEDWKFDVSLWTQFTKAEKRRRGFLLYSVLPTDKGVNEKVRLAMQNGEININDDTAVEQIFAVLDKWFKKDDLSVVCDTWASYKNLQKKNAESMDNFINEYEKNVKELKKEGIVLPDVVLAMQLLDGAGIEKKDKQIVLTAVDYSKKDEMYEQMKQALRKFFGEQTMSQRSMTRDEEAFQSDTQEAYYSRGRGYSRGGYFSSTRGYRGGRGPRYGVGRNRGNSFVCKRSDDSNPNRFQNEKWTGAARGRNSFNRNRSMNPFDSGGNRLKCHVCESVMHFIKDCPHKNNEKNEAVMENQNEEAFKVQDYSHEDKQVLMTEAAHAAILDSACTKTVTGRAWKEMYLASLSPYEKRNVKLFPSSTKFKFGGERTVKSDECMEFPCTIAGQKTTVVTDVIDSDIPLLLSKPDMKRLGFKLNMADDTLEVYGRKLDLDTTSSGHYYLPLKDCEVPVERVHMCMEQKSQNKKKRMILKLHRQFAHPSAKSLKAVVRNALDGDFDSLIDEVSKNCEICLRYKKTPARPVVSMPMAQKFNDVVAMDLTKFRDVYFIHFIDLHTRFSKSKVIRRKTPKVIIDSVVTEWIASGFGPPKRFLVDNGGEFNNEEYRELAEQFNVEVCSTAAYSPWSNGICERNHQVVDICVQKMMEDDSKMTVDVALAWAINAKNSMQNHKGFSPIQLVLGSNPNLPSVMVNDPPALENVEVSEAVSRHLSALHAARRAYAKAEASERVRRALRHNIRVVEIPFRPGDSVFYKRDDSNRWRGPAKVIGQDGKIVFIRHGSQVVRVATCRVIQTQCTVNKQTDDPETQCQSNVENVQNKEQNAAACLEDETEGAQDEDNAGAEDNADATINAGDISETICHDDIIENTQVINCASKREPVIKIPNIKAAIKYRLPENEDWTIARVLSRGGKASGKNKYYVNVVNDADKQKLGIYLDQVDFEILEEEPTNDKNICTPENCMEPDQEFEEINAVFIPSSHHGTPEVIDAKERELQNWMDFEVYHEVEDYGQQTLSTRWVISEKIMPDGQKGVKARLVVRGFEEEEKVASDSPTASKSTLRTAIAIAASERWKCETIDIKAAFLQGKKIERQVFIQPPDEVKDDGVIWKLDKTAYGLGDASRNWYFSVKEELIKLGCIQSQLDKSLFWWYNSGKMQGIFIMHVDDFLFAGTEAFMKLVINSLAVKYKVGKRQINNFQYVGLEIIQDDNGIQIKQEDYETEMAEIVISCKRKSDKSAPLTKKEIEILRATAGQLNWVATQTRPDLSFDALELNMARNHPTVSDLLRANKAVRQAKNSPGGIMFPCLGPRDEWKIEVFCDASWGNLHDGVSSAQGHVIFLTGEGGTSCPLSWTSNKIKRKVSSTLAAETLSLLDAVDEAVYLGGLISEVYNNSLENKIPITVYTDNKSLHQNIHSTKQVHEKRLRINMAEIQRMLTGGEIRAIEWVPSKLQLADCLTKKGANSDQLLEQLQVGKLQKDYIYN